jgi:hypothetical protein
VGDVCGVGISEGRQEDVGQLAEVVVRLCRANPTWRHSRNEVSGKPGAIPYMDSCADRTVAFKKHARSHIPDAPMQRMELTVN